MIRRRDFVTLLAGAAAAMPFAARAQQPAMPVIGFLRSALIPEPEATHRVTAFHQGMKETGYVEGQNVAIEYRSDEGQTDQLPLLVADLLRRQVALIIGNTPSTLAAKAATTTVPIVFVTGADPVRAGLVASLNRPGGNVTGISLISVELGSKRLGLLRELRPGAARIAVLVDPNFPLTEFFVSDVQAAASSIKKQIEVLEAPTGRDIDTVFARLAQKPTDALLVGPSPLLNNRHVQIVTLAARHRIPAIYVQRDYVEAGGLMSYAPSIPDIYRQAGIYAGRILKGEKPGDLPVMLPTKFEFVINLKTAKALGLEVPDRLLIAADEVIE
jgi:putative ABC transport system substrate-binding protein